MIDTPKHILILGGGNAGWMIANLMAHQWSKQGIKISLIESEVIGTVGVGEGSTPFIQDFFARLGISEAKWMKAANATYKCGISFPDWSTKKGFENYVHPFYSQIDSPHVPLFFDNADFRRAGININAHPDDYFVTSELIAQSRSPISNTGSNNKLDYGYHFDAELLGHFLKGEGIARGVKHIIDKVTKIEKSSEGDILAVDTLNSGRISADFFVDCSGFKGVLIQETLGESLISSDKYLYNDSAVAIQTPTNLSKKLPSDTVSQAIKHGWVWKIPLGNRFGNGYVYSSKYLSSENAEEELREHLGVASRNAKALHLKWKPGRISQHWKRNCLAVGLSQGFLEPLEAPMLNIIQSTCEGFVSCFEKGGFTNKYQKVFNSEINSLIDGTRDYLQAHYKLNSRSDSAYWRDSRNNTEMSKSLKGILEGWEQKGCFNQVLRTHLKSNAYLKTSWYCLLAGMGHFPVPEKEGSIASVDKHKQSKEAVSSQAKSFVDHAKQIEKIYM